MIGSSLGNSPQGLGEEGVLVEDIRVFRQDQANDLGIATDQASGIEIGMVLEFFHGLADLVLGFLADRGTILDDAGDC